MKAKFGAIVVDGRGKVGGHVFSKNRGGNYMRTKVTPANAQTEAQLNARSTLASYSAGWRALTEEQRNAWNAAVEGFSRTNVFGDTVVPTGKNLYTRLNACLVSVGGTPLSDPPVPADVVEPTGFAETTVVTAETLVVQIEGNDAGMYYQIWATAPLSPGVSYVRSQLRQISFAESLAAETSVFDAYEARFGSPVAGQKVFLQVVPINSATGQQGIGIKSAFVVTA